MSLAKYPGRIWPMVTGPSVLSLGGRIVLQVVLLLFILGAKSLPQPADIYGVCLGLGAFFALADIGYSFRVLNDRSLGEMRLWPTAMVFIVQVTLGTAVILGCALASHEVGVLLPWLVGGLMATFLAMSTSVTAVDASRGLARNSLPLQGLQLAVVCVTYGLLLAHLDILLHAIVACLAWILFLCSLARREYCSTDWSHSAISDVLDIRTLRALGTQLMILLVSQVDLIMASMMLNRHDFLTYLALSRGVSLIYLLHVNVMNTYRSHFQGRYGEQGIDSYLVMSRKYMVGMGVVMAAGGFLYFMGLAFIGNIPRSDVFQMSLVMTLLISLGICRIALDTRSLPFFFNGKFAIINRLALFQALALVVAMGVLGPLVGVPGIIIAMIAACSLSLWWYSRALRRGEAQ